MSIVNRNDADGERVLSTWCVSEEEIPISTTASLNFNINPVVAPPSTGLTDHLTPMGNWMLCNDVAASSGDRCCEKTSSNDGAESAAGSGERYIWVLDPLTRKLRVPVSLLVPTQATATTGTVPSLCMSFLEGRCRHQWCRQAHVPMHALPRLRHEALHAPTCCRLHMDPHDTSVLTDRFKFIRVLGSEGGFSKSDVNGGACDLIPTDRVAQTVGLLRFIANCSHSPKEKGRQQEKQSSASPGENGNGSESAEAGRSPYVGRPANYVTNDAKLDQSMVLDLPAKLVCRLHLSHRCRYLEDCNNIHICREYELHLQPPPHLTAALSSVMPTTTTITIGDRNYSSTMISLGDVTDEVFRIICDQQRQCALTSVPAAGSAMPPPSLHSHASPMIFDGSRPVDVAERITSPLSLEDTSPRTLFCNSMGSAMPAAHGGAVYVPATDLSPPQGSSPVLAATASSPQCISRVLRIYDVRPKSAAPSGQGKSGSYRSPGTLINGSAGNSPLMNGWKGTSVNNSYNSVGSSHSHHGNPSNESNDGNGHCGVTGGSRPDGMQLGEQRSSANSNNNKRSDCGNNGPNHHRRHHKQQKQQHAQSQQQSPLIQLRGNACSHRSP
uniref:C3H1-type domain-containing protein n=1 Tax=Trypanosoma congolense (strain IL3000) TaxID=1068625 RepID=G0UVG0_TRYCI|nr:conserved hypothetical protein [Trypanosoma congolense IL3000]